MSSSEEAKLYFAPADDPQMLEASQQAQGSFKYFLRELSWERKRVVPALEQAVIKVGFWDVSPSLEPDTAVEHMWLGDVEFDGQQLHGVLMNAPAQLGNYQQGQSVSVPFSRLEDWMYVLQGRAYGAYTVNLMRAKMSPGERKGHDNAWGLDFGDPEQIRRVPDYSAKKPNKPSLLGKLFGGAKETPLVEDLNAEHPMSINMGPGLVDYLKSNPGALNEAGPHGLTLLASEAMVGSTTIVKILLEQGADKKATNQHGQTALDLARLMNWPEVIQLLQ